MYWELAAIIAVVLTVFGVSLAPRLGVASPLLLIGLGFGMAMLPWVDSITVNPEWVLAGVLPPLLYAAAVNTPVMEFRRDLRLISTFSVVLVVVTAVVIGWVATVLVPGMPLGVGIALGAIISPTDAVAVSIVRKSGVSSRLVTVLEGESMLNDASALVLLRTAVAAVGVSVSLWSVVASFVWAVVAAVAIGWVVGKVNLFVRRWITSLPAGVALSLAVPFIAYLPAEHLEASGLVAAVTAGIVVSYESPRRIGAEERLAERAVWATVELLLESAVFLLVGVELPSLVAQYSEDGTYLTHPVGLATVMFTLALLIRTAFVAFGVWRLAGRNRRLAPARDRLSEIHDRLVDGELPPLSEAKTSRRVRLQRIKAGPERISRWRHMLQRRIADLDYLAAEQFSWRDGTILVWAGMRGAVTIAAAQSLPAEIAHRPLIILTATVIAVGTLIIQGLTLEPLAKRLGVSTSDSGADPDLWRELQAELDSAALAALPPAGDDDASDLIRRVRERLSQSAEGAGKNWFGLQGQEAEQAWASFRELRLTTLAGQRAKLLELRSLGTYPTAMLDDALAQLDAQQISIELRQQYD
ncbi:MAG: cation:proton antiporter [Actinobacteria bacterium HGW-Actinobacteria-2]|nr:MAG: cation:proton antiporter [Actinobacteria bacterium HGW-Actinobacteria-2]